MFKKFFKKQEEPEETPLAVRALATLQQGNYPEALKLLNEYIKMIEGFSKPLTEDDAAFYYNRALAKENLNDIDGAIIDLEKCNSIANLHQSYLRLGSLQQQKGQSDKSIKNIVRAYELGNQEAENILREYTNYFNR
jgi:tetratricopeptide (TPR) repeat protein